MPAIDIKVPDIGDFKDVAVIEVLVKPGDTVKAEQSLITVESDKASMEVPSSAAGVIKELKVKLGDKINQGDVIAIVEGAAGSSAPAKQENAAAMPSPAMAAAQSSQSSTQSQAPAQERTLPPAALH